MAQASTFSARLLVALFAASVVALGIHELNQRHGKKNVTATSQVTKELLGSVHIERGMFSIEKARAKSKENAEHSEIIGDTEKGALQGLIDSVTGGSASKEAQ